METSPLTSWLEAMDRLDFGALQAALAPDITLLTADGRQAQGHDQAVAVLGKFMAALRKTTHEVTAEWHVDDVWIAEVQATYELTDYLQTGPLPRVFIARASAEGITQLRVYGAHEHPLSEHRTGEEGMWVGGRWVPPL